MSVDLSAEIYVPVSVDAERVIEDRAMLRATYFVVTTDAPASVWELDLPPLADLSGLGALGMLGVVFSAIRPTEDPRSSRFDIFSDPADVAAIFELERLGSLTIQLEDLWIPRSWCDDAPVWGNYESFFDDVDRGEVFRIAAELFQHAYRYGTGDMAIDELAEIDASERVFRSPIETSALQGWAGEQIEITKRAFPEKKVKLRARYE